MANNTIEQLIQYQEYDIAFRQILDLAYTNPNRNLLPQALQLHGLHINNTLQQTDVAALQKLANTLTTSVAANQEDITLLHGIGVAKIYKKGNFKLAPIDIKINAGEIIGIVGENGNGKTTFLRTILAQLNKDQGEITYHNIDAKNNYAIKSKIAFIPQRIPKWFGVLKDNLHFTAAIHGIHGAENELSVQYVLARFNLTKYAKLTWNQISSGYRTRFEIARILLQQPQILVLDEPLANLDILAQQTLLTDLQLLVKNTAKPMGIVLSSQQLYEVEKVANNLIFLANGQPIYHSIAEKENTISATNTIELETNNTREDLAKILPDAEILFNGNYYTIESTATANQLIQSLLSNNIQIQYLRNITNSTKKYFPTNK